MRNSTAGALGWMLMAAVSAQAAEYVCFRTTAEAAAQTGTYDRGGYRLEAMRRDTFEGVNWATVRSCGHPELPAQLVLTSRAIKPSAPPADARPPFWSTAVLRAGSQVTLVIQDSVARIEMQGIALADGVVGDTVKVRVLSGTAGEERVAEGVVRDRTLVEVAR